MSTRAPWLFLAVCAVAAVASAAFAPWDAAWTYPLLSLLSCGALVGGVVAGRSRPPRAWMFFAAGAFLFLVGDALHAGGVGGWAVDVLYLSAYPFLLAGIAILSGRRSIGAAVDASILGVALFVLVWIAFADRHAISGWTHSEAVVAAAFPAFGLMLVLFVARLLVGGVPIRRAALVAAAAVLALVVGDVFHVVSVRRGRRRARLGRRRLAARDVALGRGRARRCAAAAPPPPADPPSPCGPACRALRRRRRRRERRTRAGTAARPHRPPRVRARHQRRVAARARADVGADAGQRAAARAPAGDGGGARARGVAARGRGGRQRRRDARDEPPGRHRPRERARDRGVGVAARRAGGRPARSRRPSPEPRPRLRATGRPPTRSSPNPSGRRSKCSS